MSGYKQYQVPSYLLKTVFPYFIFQNKSLKAKYIDKKSLIKWAENGTAIINFLFKYS